uniref:Tripartite motif containing 33 n=1 Tax=Tetraodon nigroviridis TaxID=99883 RepID=H3CEZ6_TETNG
VQSVTKERGLKLMAQHKDTAQLAQQIHHVLTFCNWAITNGSSTALLYSKRLILYQLQKLFKARLEPVPQANGVVHFYCDPTFWAKNVSNLGNLVVEKPPPPVQPPGVMGGGPPISPGQGHPGRHPGQINLAQLRLQHMQQAAFLSSHLSQQHPRQTGPPMVQQQVATFPPHKDPLSPRIYNYLQPITATFIPPPQPPRLISMQQPQRGVAVGMNGGPGPGMYPSPHHMRLPGPQHSRLPTAQPRLNGQPYTPLMQPQLQRPHSNPGHAGPFPVTSLHNANPTSPTSASMAGAHAHRSPASPISPIELIPSVTNPENLPCLPDIPPIQLEDAGTSNFANILSRYITASTQQPLVPLDINSSPGLSTQSGSSGPLNAHTPARPSSTSSTGSRGRGTASGGAAAEQVKVKQEPGTEDSYSCPSSLKTERGTDSRSACMMSSPENSPLPVVGLASPGHNTKASGESVKTEPLSEAQCPSTNGSSAASSSSTTGTTCSEKGTETKDGGKENCAGKEDDPNEDWCAVCINGGDLLCCDRCPKVFHMKCHVPTINIFPKGEFLCTFCRSLENPEIRYCEDSKTNGEGLSPEDQRRCERLLLYVFCHELSVGFRKPVSSSVPNYYKIIKKPMDLKKVKRRLQLQSSQYYKSTQEFVSDVRLIFKNCAKYNEMSRIIQVYDEEKKINTQVGSEMALFGQAVGVYFEEQLRQIFPGQDFPEVAEAEESPNTKEKEEDTDDSDEDFVQPRRKRLKTDEKVMHIK